jgi:hypothetical protein
MRTPEETLHDIERLGWSAAAKKWRREASATPKEPPIPNTKTSDAEHASQLAAMRGREIVKQRLIQRQKQIPPFDAKRGNVFRQMIIEGAHVALGKNNPVAVERHLRQLEAQAAVEDVRLAQQAEIDSQLAAIESDADVIAIRQQAQHVYEHVAKHYQQDKYLKSAAETAIDLAAQGRVDDARRVLQLVDSHVVESEAALQAQILAAQVGPTETLAASNARLAQLQSLKPEKPVEPVVESTDSGTGRFRVWSMRDGKLQLDEGGDNGTQE